VSPRLVFAALTAALLIWIVFAVRRVAGLRGPPDERAPAPGTVAAAPVGPPAGAAAALETAALRRRVRVEHARLLQAHRKIRRLQHRWRPTVDYAIRLASAVTGVPAAELYAVARCESGLSPAASNGRYLGLFQLGWDPFGFSPFDPVANALSAAMTVKRDGSWRQWTCRP
jgi:predicted secreted protein